MPPNLLAIRRQAVAGLKQPPIGVWYHPEGWMWLGTKLKDDGIYFGLVISPHNPQGGWGYWMEEQLNEYGALRDSS